jgi:hypothetical protein
MTMRVRNFGIAAGAVAALAAVGAVVALAASGGSWHPGWGRMDGRYVYRPAQPTAVRTIADARTQAQRFADRLGLHVGEVMQFKRNFYVKLVDANGDGATEVLVDPSTGVVSIEYGPAMMWNTRYGMGRTAGSMMGSYGRGMMGAGGGMMSDGYGQGMTGSGNSGQGMMGSGTSGQGMIGGAGATTTTARQGTTVSLAQARTLAQRWLDDNEPGVHVESGGDVFPGYDTLETLKDGKITGMISVNTATGAVWPHWWHGAFVATSA